MTKALKLDNRGKLALSEADVTKQCVTWLRLNGWECKRQHRGKFVGYAEALHKKPHNWHVIEMGEDGDPDWLVLRRSHYSARLSARLECRLFYLEFKKPGGKLRPTQVAKIAVLEKAGYLVCVADSLEGLQKWIEEVAGA